MRRFTEAISKPRRETLSAFEFLVLGLVVAVRGDSTWRAFAAIILLVQSLLPRPEDTLPSMEPVHGFHLMTPRAFQLGQRLHGHDLFHERASVFQETRVAKAQLHERIVWMDDVPLGVPECDFAAVAEVVGSMVRCRIHW